MHISSDRVVMHKSLDRVDWSRGYALWVLHSPDDLKKIAAPGYFNGLADRGMRRGDELRIVCGTNDVTTCTYTWGIFCDVPEHVEDGERDITIALLSSGVPTPWRETP